MAQLNPVIEKVEDVAEPLRQFYVAKDGKFHLDLSGAPAGFASAAELAAANGKVVEFRDNNVQLKKTVDELMPFKTNFEGIDHAEAKAAIAAKKELEKKGVKGADDVAKIVTDAIAAANKPLIDRIAATELREQETAKRNADLVLRSTLGEKFTKAGGQPEALDFIVGRASGVFTVQDGKLVAAANQFSADRPGEPLSVEEWMTRQTKEAGFAFKASGGGGANPSGGAATPRPGVTVIKDPTAAQLGDPANVKLLREGKIRFEYST